MSTVVVPYVAGHLHPETEQWATDFGATLHELSSDLDGYWKALVNWWKLSGDLLIVEQDMVPAPGVVLRMLECGHMWCSSSYGVLGPSSSRCWVTYDGATSVPRVPPRIRRSPVAALQITDGLGCAKFTAELKHSLPEIMVAAGKPNGDRNPPGDWRVTDSRLSKLLRENGLVPHLHERSVHRHPYWRSSPITGAP